MTTGNYDSTNIKSGAQSPCRLPLAVGTLAKHYKGISVN